MVLDKIWKKRKMQWKLIESLLIKNGNQITNSEMWKVDYLIFVKYFFINLLYYFFVWQTSENDIFFKKLYLFHFFYAKI